MFKNKHLFIWCFILSLAVLAGCKSKFEKLQQSNDIAKKYQEAIRLYNKKSYSKALTLFDDLMQRYRGRAEAEDLAHYTALTNYALKDYTTARYQFKVFADSYPNSPKAEEARYMAAYCYYLESPNFSLDQQNTISAIEALQLFINLYPKSARAQEAANLIQNLRDKLERKSFANARLYLDIGDYKSAVIAFANSLHDYPDTKYAEEMEYLSVKAQYLYALNSLETKQEERFGDVINLANDFAEDYPQSKYLKEVSDHKKQSEQKIVEVKKLLAVQAQPEEKSKSNSEDENKSSENE